MIRKVLIVAVASCIGLVPGPAASEVRSLPVPAAAIHAGGIIAGSMVKDRQFRVTATSIAGFATSRGQLLGMLARHRLPAGKPIPLAALKLPAAVKRGASAPAVYADQGVSIETFLIALEDGEAGAIITARNPATGTVVRASVNADGTLSLGAP